MGRFLGCVVLLGLAGCALDRSGHVGEGGSGEAASSGEGGAPATDGPAPSSVSAVAASGAGVSTSASASSSSGSAAGGSVGSSASSTDASSAASTSGSGGADPVCGNDEKEEGEDCDDGDTTPGDRCDATCHEEHPDVCPGTPIRLGGGSFVIQDTTVGADDTLQDTQGEGCPGGEYPGADLIYAVSPMESGHLSARLDAGYDQHLLIVRTACPSTGDDVLDCDSHFDADNDGEVYADVEVGTTYFLEVDSWGGQAGTFELVLELDPD